MTHRYADRIKNTTGTVGTGAYSLSPPPSGGWASIETIPGLVNGDTVDAYVVRGSQWEVGTYTYSGGTLQRTAIDASSSGGAPVNWANGGPIEIGVTFTAKRLAAILSGLGGGGTSGPAIDDTGTAGDKVWSSEKTAAAIAAAIAAIDLPEGGAIIDDASLANNRVWSAQKTDAQLDAVTAAISAIPAPSSLINDGAPAGDKVWSSQETADQIATATAGVAAIDDEVVDTDTTWSSAEIVAYVEEAIDGNTTTPPTPALTPANGSATFDQDVANSYDLATSNVDLVGINVSSSTLPAGLTASIIGFRTLRLSGTPTVATPSDTYSIIVNRAAGGGTLTFTLTLVVNAPPVTENWEYLKNETETFDLDEPFLLRFGVGDDWVTATVPAGNGYTCNLELIQAYNPGATDPKPFFTKHCEISPVPSAAPATARLTEHKVIAVTSGGALAPPFPADAHVVTYADRANTQAHINTYGKVFLNEAKDYGQDITLGSNQEIYMIPFGTQVNKITITPGATNWRVFGGYGAELRFPDSDAVTKNGSVSSYQSPVRSIGGCVQDVDFLNMSGQHYLNSSTSAGGFTRSTRWIGCWEQIAGIFQDQFGAQDAGFTLIGSAGRGDDGNVVLSHNALNPWNDAMRVEGQKNFSLIGCDIESYYLPHNGQPARFNFANCGTVNLVAAGGNTFADAIRTSADVTNIIHAIYNPYIEDAQGNKTQRIHVDMRPGAQAVHMWGSYNNDGAYIANNSGGSAVFMRNGTDGGLYRNQVKQADGAALTGATNTAAYASLVSAAPQAAQVWAKVPQFAYSDPLGSGWAATKAGKTDESAALQALLDAAAAGSKVVILEARAYYVSATVHRRRGVTLMGAMGGGTSIVALNDTVNILDTYYPENFNGGDSVIGIAFYGGKSHIYQHEPQTQWYSGYIGFCSFLHAVDAGILLDNSYAIDHSYLEYNTFVDCAHGIRQVKGTGAINGPNEMYADKTPFYRHQFISCGWGIHMTVLRSNNMLQMPECLFKNCTQGAIFLDGGHNYMSFVNCKFDNNAGANPIDFPPYNAVTFVGCDFIAHASNAYLFTQGVMAEGCTFTKNGNSTVRVLDPTRHLFESASGFTSGFFNCSGDMALGPVLSNPAAVLSINSQWQPADGLFTSALSNVSYETLGTPSGGDDVRTQNLGYVTGPVIPGTRLLIGAPVAGGTTTPPPPDEEDPDLIAGLNRFKTNFAPGDVILSIGDSTAIREDFNQRMLDQTVSPGGELEGAQLVVRAFNGQTVEMIDDALDEAIASYPNIKLVIWRAGINNVRIGTDSTASLTLKNKAAVERTRLLMPDADILWTIPNSLLSTDPTGEGWVQPNTAQASQDYTDRMWNAGKAVEAANYDHVQVYDSQTDLYGRIGPATSPYLRDRLHPGTTGQLAEHAQVVQLIKPFYVPIDLTASAAAWASNPTHPETIYARAWEDTRYATLVREIMITGNFPGFKLVYLGRRGQDSTPLSGSILPTGGVLWTPYGAYIMSGSENKNDFSDGSGFQIVYPTTFPTNAAPVNARIYTLVP